MRKNTTKALLLTGALGVAMTATAAPKLSLNSAYAFAGQSVELELTLSGATTPCAGINAKIILPPGVSLLGIEKGGLLYPGQFATDSKTFSGGCTLIAYSGTDTFSGSDGTLLRLRLAVGAQVTPGSYPIMFAAANTNINVNSRYALSDATGEHSLAVTPENGTLIVDTDNDHDQLGDTWEQYYFSGLGRDGTGDYDGDGLADGQEFLHGTNPTMKDTDTDGMNDLAELIAGTNPLDYYDCFELADSGVVTNSGPFVFYWDSKVGRNYTIYTTTNLNMGWDSVTNLMGDGTRKVYSNAVPSARVRRFFRLEVQETP